MTSAHGGLGRALGVWGTRAYAWSGEERPRAAGFPIDPSGRQRVLGFPADPPGTGYRGWFHKPARPEPEPARRRRLIVAVVAILPGEGKQGRAG